jgi:hypothetical protein
MLGNRPKKEFKAMKEDDGQEMWMWRMALGQECARQKLSQAASGRKVKEKGRRRKWREEWRREKVAKVGIGK